MLFLLVKVIYLISGYLRQCKFQVVDESRFWCCSECFGHQIMYFTESKTALFVFMVMKEHATNCVTVTYQCVKIVFRQQWCSVALRMKIFQAVRHTVLDTTFIVGLGLQMRFLDRSKSI